MHIIYIGVVKLLFDLWFDSTNHQSPWYIGKYLIMIKHIQKYFIILKILKRTKIAIDRRKDHESQIPNGIFKKTATFERYADI